MNEVYKQLVIETLDDYMNQSVNSVEKVLTVYELQGNITVIGLVDYSAVNDDGDFDYDSVTIELPLEITEYYGEEYTSYAFSAYRNIAQLGAPMIVIPDIIESTFFPNQNIATNYFRFFKNRLSDAPIESNTPVTEQELDYISPETATRS